MNSNQFLFIIVLCLLALFWIRQLVVIRDLLTTSTRETWSLENFLAELLEKELEGRRQCRTERLQKISLFGISNCRHVHF